MDARLWLVREKHLHTQYCESSKSLEGVMMPPIGMGNIF